MDSSLAFDIVETARLIRREANRRVVLTGTTRTQWRVLARLNRMGGGLRQVELAEALDMEPISMCRVLDRLEENGLVERRRDPSDRRAWLIYLTDKAAPVLEEFAPHARQFEEEFCAGLDADERAQIEALMAKVRSHLGVMEAARAARLAAAS